MNRCLRLALRPSKGITLCKHAGIALLQHEMLDLAQRGPRQVVNKDNVVEQRTVTIGQLDNQMRVIESGLKAEDWVVTDGIQRAIPGGKVEPDKQKMVASAGG